MHTNEWDNTYKKVKKDLGREPTTREIQEELYRKHFGEIND